MTSSRVRLALDELLRRYPGFDLVSIDWNLGSVYESGAPAATRRHAGAFVFVGLGQPSENFDDVPAWAVHRFAIRKSTGALYPLDGDEVADGPLWVPE